MNIIIQPQSVSAEIDSADIHVIIPADSVSADAHPDEVDVSFGFPIIREITGGEIYDGDYTAVPSTEDQVFQTRGKLMRTDFTVGKIPSNYGLITWNGSTLTVS